MFDERDFRVVEHNGGRRGPTMKGTGIPTTSVWTHTLKSDGQAKWSTTRLRSEDSESMGRHERGTLGGEDLSERVLRATLVIEVLGDLTFPSP